MKTRRTSDAGFTLLELLVAMAIFAIIGVLAMGGLNSVLTQKEQARRQLDRLHQVQRAVRILTNDFSQIVPRSVRDEVGGVQLAFASRSEGANCPSDYVACLTRDGWRNPFQQFPRGTLQRVQYKLDDGKLYRENFAVLDRTLANQPRQEVLLDGVDRFELSFMDVSSNGEWQMSWPPSQQGTANMSGYLQAVRIDMVLKDWGEIVRIAEVVPFTDEVDR